MKVIHAHGVKLATETFGNPGDPAVLFLMGATASMLSWPDALCTDVALSGRFVVRFDHRDTGQSTTVTPGTATYSVEDLAADALAILDAYRIGKAHLVGMSLGGYVGQILAVRKPDRVASLTLIGSEPLGWDGPPLPHISDVFMQHFAKIGDVDWSDDAEAADFMLEIARLCAAGGPFDPVAERAVIGRVLARTDSPLSAFNHGSLATREDWKARFRDITCPTLVIHGDLDPILPLENGEALAEGVKGARMEVLEGVGHALPGEVIPRLVALISRQTAR